MSSRKRREKGWARIAMAVVLGLAIVVAGAAVAFAQGGGGTAKPPVGATSPFVTPTLADPLFSVAPAGIHGFDETGFIQDATVSGDNSACPDVSQANRLGGTVTINNTTIVVPCNMVIQMPANTMTWADFVNGGPVAGPQGQPVPVVRGSRRRQHRGRQAHRGPAVRLAAGREHRQRRDHEDRLRHRRPPVDTGDPAHPAIVRINDPNGRFGRAQSPDARFSVDDQNPTVHAGTGYPMCVPRTDPASADDPLCPQTNRPNLARRPGKPRRAATAATSATRASPRCRAAAS